MILGSQTILCLENDNVTMSSEISGHVSRYRFASTGLSLIKNENDIEIPKEEEGVFGDFEKDGDESASLAAEFPDHTADEDFQETTIASEETESHSAIVEEAKGDSASQAESLSDQLQDDEKTTENVPASPEIEQAPSAIPQTEVVSSIQEEDSTAHGDADQESASPASPHPFLSLVVLPLAVLAI
ncbi:hypothetical protein CRM22_008809 [Opisthorchis felineus]|uniref:Uncharacterized protein n=1 Tax=Opisthorchis felineus TaxID=147828 RepID=A0A4S2L9F8_OPIFE|nr:hypothetical protein CRM22_008809 [Opisthorchis felineus]